MNDGSFNNAVGPHARRHRAPHRRAVAVLLAVTVVAALQTATQVWASDFEHQPVLGSPWGFGLYAPWSILSWAYAWGEQYPEALARAANGGLLALCSGVLVTVAVRLVLDRRNPFLHGSARWADVDDIRRAGLLPDRTSLRGGEAADEGVYVGAWTDGSGRTHYLRHDGPEHVLCYAPTRSGKGVALVVPTLLSWRASAFVTDLKGELWELTAGWRKQAAQNRALRFEPASREHTVRWNPLDEIRLDTDHAVGDAQNLATLLVDPDGKGMETHWQKTAQALLVGVILHVIYKARAEGTPAHLAEVDHQLANPQRAIADLWQEMVSYPHVDGECHPVVGAAARDMLDRPEEEAGSVLSTAKSYLALYRDPVVRANTSTSDFCIRDLMHGPRPVSLYLVTQPADKDRLRPLVRIVINMILRVLADKVGFEAGQPKPLYKHRLLLMLDEFTAARRLEILQESLAYCAGYGIKAYLICQDLEQLQSRSAGYGSDETITSNCHVQVAFRPNRMSTAEHLSRATGQTSVKHEQVTRNGWGPFAQRSRTTQWIQRPLLTPDECLRLPGARTNAAKEIVEPGDMLIFAAGCPAIYGKQPLYFRDRTFAARAKVPPPKEMW